MSEIIPDWIVAAGTALPVVTGFCVWLATKWSHARSDQLARAREEGRAEQLRAQQAAVTEAFHRRFDAIEKLVDLVPGHRVQLERHERIIESVRDACVAGGLMVPSGTQAGSDGRGVRIPTRSPSRPPPMPPMARPPPFPRPK